MGFVILAIIVIAFIVVITNISVVQQSRAYVIERLGAFHSVWGVGMHFKVPFIDRIARRVSLKEQVLDYPPQPVITKDNVTMQIDTVVYFQITDPKLYAYGVEQPMAAMETLTATTLRNIIGDLELDQTLTSRDVVNTKMRSILDEATDPWGIKVNRVALKNILPAIANEFVTIIKESSICYTIGVQEIMYAVSSIKGATYRIAEPLVVAACVYFCLTFPTSKIIAYFERRMSRGDRR